MSFAASASMSLGTEGPVPVSTNAARPSRTRRWLASSRGRMKPVSMAVMPCEKSRSPSLMAAPRYEHAPTRINPNR